MSIIISAARASETSGALGASGSAAEAGWSTGFCLLDAAAISTISDETPP